MPNKKLEIIKSVNYLCPICSRPHYSLERAEKCRDRGIIGDGPEINPGLVVKGIFDDTYSIFYNEFRQMHYRYDEFINLKNQGGLKVDYINDVSYLKRDHVVQIKKQIILLDENEFGEFRRLVKKDLNFKGFGLQAIHALENLYNYYEWFDNNLG